MAEITAPAIPHIPVKIIIQPGASPQPGQGQSAQSQQRQLATGEEPGLQPQAPAQADADAKMQSEHRVEKKDAARWRCAAAHPGHRTGQAQQEGC